MQSSRAEKLEDLHDASMAETVACWKVIEAVVFHGIPRVQLETDSMLLQKGVQTVGDGPRASRNYFPGYSLVDLGEFLSFQVSTCSSSL